MATGFDVQVRGDIVIVVGMGVPAFDEASNALASAIAEARVLKKKILFDHRLLDLSNYYGYIVRHAEMAPYMGLDGTFRMAHVGTPSQDEVMSFMVLVGHNRGWNVRCFFDFDEALRWLGS